MDQPVKLDLQVLLASLDLLAVKVFKVNQDHKVLLVLLVDPLVPLAMLVLVSLDLPVVPLVPLANKDQQVVLVVQLAPQV
jgi:hypothetical protein